MKGAVKSFESRYTIFENGSIVLYTDESPREDLDREIFADIQLKKYPVREFNSVINDLTNVIGTYEKLNHRNHKKDDEHLTYLIDFYADAAAKAEHRAYARKEYTLQSYDGGFYLLHACSMMCPDGEHTLGGISVWDRWGFLPQTVTEGFAELGVVGVSREDYDVVKYGRDGLYVHVLRLQAGKEDWEGLDGYVSCVYTTSPDYPSPRGLRVGDPEANAAETMNALWGSFEYELQDGAICRMGFFSYYDAGGPGEAFTVRPADSRPGN